MATQSYEELIASATKIKNNELPESNTHDVVGDHLVQMATKAQEEYNQRVTGICEYNVSKQFPTGGIEGSNKYTLELALQKVPTELRQTVGLKCSFLGEDGMLESWEYQGGTFTAVGSWLPVGGKKVSELDNKKQNRTDYFEATTNANALKIKDAIKEIYINSKYAEPLSVYRIIRKKTDDNKYYIYISNTTGTIGYKISYTSDAENSFISASGNGMTMYAIIDWSVLDEGVDYRSDVKAILNDNAYSLNQSPILSTYLSNNKDITNISNKLNELYDDTILGVSKIYEKLTYNVGEKVEETSIISQSYIAVSGVIYSVSDASMWIKVYQVNRGDNYVIKGSAGDTTFTTFSFSQDAPTIKGTSVPISIGSPTSDILFHCPSDGYILLWHRGSSLELNLYNCTIKDVSSAIKEVQEETEEKLAVEKISYVHEGSILQNSYITNLGVIKSVSDNGMWLKIYPVKKGEQYTIYGNLGTTTFIGCAFTSVEPTLNLTTEIISTETTNVEIDYSVNADGYILLWHRNEFAQLDLKKHEKSYITAQDIYNLVKNDGNKNLTIALLGDSIIQSMADNSDYDNTITFKPYDGDSADVYTNDEVTVVNGIIYLTSTLVDGSPIDTSMRLEVINSAQSEIDSMGWDELKDELSAKDVINCGFGSARVVEKGVVTKYPAVNILEEGEPGGSTIGSNGEMASLPNEVKMLIRLVDDGVYQEPDVIVIWIGINGVDTVITDTLDDAMKLDYDVLSDDVEGYTYRTKFYGAMRYSLETLYRRFPYTNIMVFSPVQTNRGDYTMDGEADNYRGYTSIINTCKAMSEICNRYATTFINATAEIGIANFGYKADEAGSSGDEVVSKNVVGNVIRLFLSDGLHPNNRGKVLWKNYLAIKIRNNYFSKRV